MRMDKTFNTPLFSFDCSTRSLIRNAIMLFTPAVDRYPNVSCSESRVQGLIKSSSKSVSHTYLDGGVVKEGNDASLARLRWWLPSASEAQSITSANPGKREREAATCNLQLYIHFRSHHSLLSQTTILHHGQIHTRRTAQSNHVNITAPTLPPSRPHQTLTARTSTRGFSQLACEQQD
jgi:hypothetical protein